MNVTECKERGFTFRVGDIVKVIRPHEFLGFGEERKIHRIFYEKNEGYFFSTSPEDRDEGPWYSNRFEPKIQLTKEERVIAKIKYLDEKYERHMKNKLTRSK